MTGPELTPAARWRRVLLLCLLVSWLPATWAQGRVLLIWAEQVNMPPSPGLLEEVGAANGLHLTWVREVAGRFSLLEWRATGAAMEEAEALARLAADPRIAAVQPDTLRRLQFVPNDPRFVQQWYLYDAAGINAPAAWDLQRGSAAVVIAVQDTGKRPHQDIDATRVLPGYDFYSDVIHDNDGQPGWDADPTDPGDAVVADECGPGTEAESSSWHGLAVDGILMATADNGLGIAGVDHRARLLPIRVFGKCGAWASDIFDAMRWAAGLSVANVPVNPYPARVINLSLAYDAPCGSVEQSIINEVIARGAVVVAAAGNEAGNVANVSPASCSGVITVAASDQAGARASFTNVGSAVDITAPGVSLMTTYNQGVDAPGADGYAWVSGTSFSTPQVAGVLGLMLADRPGATVNQLRQALLAGARPFPDSSCNTNLCGAGLLDAQGALLALRALPAPTPATGGGGGGCVQGSESRPEGLWWLGLAWVLYRLWRRNDYVTRQV
jgi:serine protease